MNKTTSTLIVLTFVGMVGLYYGLWRLYQKYQDTTKPGTIGGVLASLGG